MAKNFQFCTLHSAPILRLIIQSLNLLRRLMELWNLQPPLSKAAKGVIVSMILCIQFKDRLYS